MPSPAASARLIAGVASAELLVDTSAHVHAFRCRAQADGAGITVHLTDGVHVSQRRSYSRVRLAVATRLLPSGHPEPFYTTTIDVSGGGAQIPRDGGIPVVPSYEVALAGPLLPALVSAEAVPARVSEKTIGLRFTAIDPRDRQLLLTMVLRALTGELPVDALADHMRR